MIQPLVLKRLRQVLSFGIGIGAIGYLVHFVSSTAAHVEARALLSGGGVFGVLATAMGAVASVGATGWAWRRILEARQVRFPTRRLTMIVGLTQLAKYLPGNIGHHLARAALAYRYGIRPGDVAGSLALEAALTVAAAGAVGALGYGIAIEPLLPALALVLVCAGLYHMRSSHRAAFLAYVLNFILVGTGLYLLASAVSPMSLDAWPKLIGAFAFAWVAGFVVPGAPAGLGVREGILVGLLPPLMGSANVLTVVLGFRIATTIGDLMSFGVGSVLYLQSSRAVAGGEA